MKNKRDGFGFLEIILAVGVLGLILYAWTSHQKKADSTLKTEMKKQEIEIQGNAAVTPENAANAVKAKLDQIQNQRARELTCKSGDQDCSGP